MQVLKLFRDSLINFNTTIRAINLKTSQRLVYMFLLAAILAVPYMIQSIHVAEVISANGKAVAQVIPDFTLADGKLQSATQEPFIYETDYLTYAYDPQGEIDFNEVAGFNPVGFALETNPDNHSLSVLGRTFYFPHSEAVSGFNQQTLKILITDTTNINWQIFPLMFLTLALTMMAYVALLGVVIALFTSFITANKGLPIFFTERFNLALSAMTFPVIGLTLLQLFGYLVPFHFEIIVAYSLIRLYAMIRHTKVITINKNEDEQP